MNFPLTPKLNMLVEPGSFELDVIWISLLPNCLGRAMFATSVIEMGFGVYFGAKFATSAVKGAKKSHTHTIC
jgi:hypothetical protein